MPLIVVFKASIIAFILLLPGCIFSFAIFKNRLSVLAHFILGLAAGLVILINLNVLISFLGGIARGSLVVGLLILYSSSFGLLVARKPKLGKLDISPLKNLENLILLAVVGWSIVVRLVPLAFSEYPLGSDSSFHALIAKIIALTRHIPTTWQPFEKIPLNYPWGSHVFVNDVSLLGSIKIHQAFAVLNSVFFGALSVAAVYMLARLFYKDKLPAVMAAAAYGLLANWGSLNYLAWGGLPNQMGMFVFLCVSYVLLEDGLRSLEKAILAGMLLSGIVLIHNHAMLVSLYILTFYALVALLGKRRMDADLRTILAALPLAFIFSFHYSWQFLGKALTAETSGVFKFKESLNVFNLPLYTGIPFMIFFIIGLVSYERKNDRNYLYLLSWKVSLFMAFAIFYYLWKLVTKAVWGETYVALTPSRFVTDLVYPLSILAGGGLVVVAKAVKRYSVSLTLLLFLLLGLVPFYYTVGFYKQVLPAQVVSALTWVKENTPANSLIVNNNTYQTKIEEERDLWVPYISERESTFTPLPTTDLPDGRIFAVKHWLSTFVLRSIGWEDYPKDRYVREFGNQPVYFYIDRGVSSEHFSEVYVNKNIHIYKVDIQRLLR